jgi:hypothetical protein
MSCQLSHNPKSRLRRSWSWQPRTCCHWCNRGGERGIVDKYMWGGIRESPKWWYRDPDKRRNSRWQRERRWRWLWYAIRCLYFLPPPTDCSKWCHNQSYQEPFEDKVKNSVFVNSNTGCRLCNHSEFWNCVEAVCYGGSLKWTRILCVFAQGEWRTAQVCTSQVTQHDSVEFGVPSAGFHCKLCR